MKMSFIGDIMLGRQIANKYKKSPYNLVFNELVEEISSADFVVANLESPIIRSDIPVKDHMCFAGNPAFLKQFSWVDLFSLANNHINDFGDVGITETQEELDKASIAHNGVYQGKYEPFLIENEKVAIITLTDLLNHELTDSSYSILT